MATASPSGNMPMSPESPPGTLAALQKRFSDHIRDPEHSPAPEGIEDRRMAIYRRLFYNNLSSLFGKNFATARRIVPDRDWQRLIRAFMIEHRPTTPLFPEIGREFVRFLADHPEHYTDWPWLAELCHWQFQLTSVRNDEVEPTGIDADPEGDPMTGHPVVNPTLRMAQYHWPVHTIKVGRLPKSGQPAGQSTGKPLILAVFRKPDDKLGRMKINAGTARMLEIVQENPGLDGLKCLELLAREAAHPDPAQLIGHGRNLLASLIDARVLLGTSPTKSTGR